MHLISPDRQCPGNSGACDHLEGIPEFTWSIVAAGDLRQERTEKTEKKEGSPQGSEEGKNEGIMFLRCRGISLFNKLSQSVFSHALIFLALVEFNEECTFHYFFLTWGFLKLWSLFVTSFFCVVHDEIPLCTYAIMSRQKLSTKLTLEQPHFDY